MKKNLSTEALKGFRKDNNSTPLKRRNADPTNTPPNASIQVKAFSNVAGKFLIIKSGVQH